MKYIENQWKSYKQTLPEGSTELEISEAKLSFYAGATGLFHVMMDKAKDTAVSQKDGSHFLHEIHMEIDEFCEEAIESIENNDKE